MRGASFGFGNQKYNFHHQVPREASRLCHDCTFTPVTFYMRAVHFAYTQVTVTASKRNILPVITPSLLLDI